MTSPTSTPVFEFSYRFPFPKGDQLAVLTGTYHAGQPPTGLSGPPENYDPGEPAYFELQRAEIRGIPLEPEELHATLTAAVGSDRADEMLEEACEAAALAFEKAHPAPCWGEEEG